jgi:ribosome biogenesis GTPase
MSEVSTDLAKSSREGLVIACHGRRVVVRDAAGLHHGCSLFGRRLSAVCGDSVQWQPAAAAGADGLVTAIGPRRTRLERIDARGEAEVVAANLTRLVAVLAPLPAPDFHTCDAYLAGAVWAGIGATIVLNKCELAEAADPALRAELARYRDLGYPVFETTRARPDSDTALAQTLSGETAVLVGQSGVGKSSLTNRLIPARPALEGEISRHAGAGRHTTTASTLYPLPGGGALIDSPGVRGFAPPLPEPRWVASGFVEIERHARACRFPDCLHDGTAGCAVEVAAGDGRIHARRYDSYLRLLRLAQRFDTDRRQGGRRRPVRK